MSKVILVSACLACASFGRRLQESNERFQSNPFAGRPEYLTSADIGLASHSPLQVSQSRSSNGVESRDALNPMPGILLLLLVLHAADAFRPSDPRLCCTMKKHVLVSSRSVLPNIKMKDQESEKLRITIAGLQAEIAQRDEIIADRDAVIESMRKDKGRQMEMGAQESPKDTTAFVKDLLEQQPTELRDGVAFTRYDDQYVNPPIAGDPSDRQVMLYLPGLDFSGISGFRTFPSLASRYELWRCRVEPTDRSVYSELADTITGFLEEQIRRGKNVTLIGESMGGLIAVGVAQRLVKGSKVGSAEAAGIAGLILVNPATSYSGSAISKVGPIIASAPADRFALPILPDIEVDRGNQTQNVRPQLSLYGIAGGAVLGVTVPSVSQIVSGIQEFVNDALSSSSSPPGTAPDLDSGAVVLQLLGQRANTVITALDFLVSRIPPSTLSWRLRHILSAGCSDVNPRLDELKDKGLPVLFVAGDQDRLLPSSEEAKRFESVLGPETCQAVILKDSGHAAMDDRLDILKLIDDCPAWK